MALLQEAGIGCAMIGAGALANHGVARATGDLDLLTVAADALLPPTWNRLRQAGCEVEIRVGDPDDPLAGVVRVSRESGPPIDLIVGDRSWQRRAIERAEPCQLQGARVPVVGVVDLVLLKLYAAGPQDVWDVRQLLDRAPDRDRLVRAVEAGLGELGDVAATAWREATRP